MNDSLPPEITLRPGEEFVPLDPAEFVPSGYFAGPDEPEIPTPVGGKAYWWFDTNIDQNCVKMLKVSPSSHSESEDNKMDWIKTNKHPKYVVNDDNEVIGKIVTRFEAGLELDAKVSFRSMLDQLEEDS